MNLKRNLRLFLISASRPVVFWIVATSIAGFLLFYKLGTLVPGLSPQEVQSITNATSLRQIAASPFNAPFTLSVHALIYLGRTSPFALRSISAVLGLIMSWLFFYVLKRWYSVRIAILGTLIFISSSWFLHLARLATPVILQLSLVAALAWGTWTRRPKILIWLLPVGVFMTVWFLYVPGFIWFVIIAFLWQRKTLVDIMQRTPTWAVSISYVLGVVLLLPLVRALILSPSMLKVLFGLPQDGWPTINTILHNIVSVPEQLFIRGPANPSLWLDRLPLLDVFSITMLIIGIYSFYFKRDLDRTKMFGSTIISTILIGFGSINIGVLLPFIYILIAAGITLMLQQWFTVFPRNPLARMVGTGLITVAVLLTLFYNISSYFVAWPNAPVTKTTFTSKNR